MTSWPLRSRGGRHRATAEAIKGLAAIPDVRRRLELMLDAASERPRARVAVRCAERGGPTTRW